MSQGESPFAPQGGYEPKPTEPETKPWPLRLFGLWFGLTQDVGMLGYALSGFGLMAFKYAMEWLLIYHYTQRFFNFIDFLNPLLSVRSQYLNTPAPDWLGWALFVWSLPFLWVAVSMSVRRAANAGTTAWLGLGVLVPGLNYVIMLLLCCLPTKRQTAWKGPRPAPVLDHQLRSALIGIVSSLALCFLMLGLGVYVLADYGVTLFLGTPILIGVTSAYAYNSPQPRGLPGSILVAEVAIILCGLTVLLFALEGVICLAMLAPIAMVMALLGSLIGYALAVLTPARATTFLVPLTLLPLLAGAETFYRPTPTYEVETVVEIDAPPEVVWPHVVGFSELPPPPNWYFRLGIAYPQRATINGTGVGAVRHCEFSTGAFVEPITVWDEPRRLSFDVASQPPPMHELSPYRHVHPPHLDGYLRCQRGEFRLIRLPDNRTRLEGSTWYEFEMYPQDYWTLWSDLCIHRIHTRVLNHIKHLAENDFAEDVAAL